MKLKEAAAVLHRHDVITFGEHCSVVRVAELIVELEAENKALREELDFADTMCAKLECVRVPVIGTLDNKTKLASLVDEMYRRWPPSAGHTKEG